jgi:crotonobetainyl-CoA:carnitine CoA-transferase CaiB-like acyl-CoA transferase
VVLPLRDLRVIDLTDGRGEGCGRFLADLGADVVLVEPPGGVGSRRAFPRYNGTSLAFAAGAANKRSVVLDLAADSGDRSRFLDLLAGADLWIDGTDPGVLAPLGLGPPNVRRRFPHLVVVSVTEFGLSGPYRDWAATDWVHLALTPSLSRSGVPGRPPLMPPGRMADTVAGVQAAWVALVAYWNRLETGEGDDLDLSVFEAAAQVLDPAAGSVGTAAAATDPQGRAARNRGRPPGVNYPIFACADGYVRLVILAPRQWAGMFDWLGRPAEFADARYDRSSERFAAAGRLYPLIGALFRHETMLDLVGEGQRRGVPIAPMLSLDAVLDVEHFVERGTFVDVDIDGRTGSLPSGYVLIDGTRAGITSPAPGLAAPGLVGWAPRATSPASRTQGRRPLDGLRVLDLGVIVMGAEAGRLFADQGASVLKVESRQFPDGARAAGMTASLASGQRNKRSVGCNLRHPDGVAVFERFVAVSDVVLSNFKPGTMESLGLGYDRLSAINPGVVLVTSSAMGERGPWRNWMGYGPLVRCVSGLTSLWRDPGSAGGFADGATIFPDHLVGRIVDVAVLASLIARRAGGRGAHIESSQAEAILVALAPAVLSESLQPGTIAARVTGGQDAPWGVYPCAGEDEWCVVTVRHDKDWRRLIDAIGRPVWATDPALATTDGRLAARDVVDTAVANWTREQAPQQVTALLQAAGVPAAGMQRIGGFLQDPHLRSRGFFRTFTQPGTGDVVTT